MILKITVNMLILDLKGGGSIKRLLIITFIIVLDTLIAFQTFAYAEIITENEIFVTLYESKKIPHLIPQGDVKIIWAVKDSEIASISSKGKVKGLSVGKTEITATAGELTGSCTLYVKEPLPSLEISYTGNAIFGCEPLSEYNINGKTYISDTDGKIPIQNEWLGRTIQISKKNVIEKCCSDSISLFIEHAHRFLIISAIAPTCLLGGYSIYKCKCGETMNSDFVPANGHKLSDFYYDGDCHYQNCLSEGCGYIQKETHDFENSCDATCNTCGFERKIEHQFDNSCDTDCNICNYVRTISHKYENICDDTCIICGFKRTVSHSFDYECDTKCNLCGFTRIAAHKFENECDSTCSICGYKRTVEHKYKNQCDAVCDICGYTREIKHKLSNAYSADDTSHFFECKICGEVFERQDHIFDNSCDAECNVCNFKRDITHDIPKAYYYNKKSHYNLCRVCQDIFNKESHIYDDTSDTTCNICGFVRSVKKKSNSKKDLKPTNNQNDKTVKETKTPESAKKQKKITDINKGQKETNNKKKFIDMVINRGGKARYIIAFSGTGTTIASMVLLIVFKKHKKPRA